MSTRSAVHLSGKTSDYLLPQSKKSKKACKNDAEIADSTTATSTDVTAATTRMSPTTGGGAPTGDGAPNGDAPTQHEQMMTILGKLAESMSLMAAATANNAGQSANTQSVQQQPKVFSKLEDCPIKRKTVSLESWLREVELWDECNKVDEDSYGKKYQKLITSIRNSEEAEDLNALVSAEFVENVNFERSKADTITKMIDVIKTKLGSTNFEKSTDAWLNFVNIKQKSDETAKEFCNRFLQAETMLKNVGIKMHENALAIHLLDRSNLNSVSRENVLTKVNTDDNKNIYQDMAKAIKEIKSLAVEEKTDPNKTFFSENSYRRPKSQGDYSRQSRPRRSDSKGDYSRQSRPWRSNSRNDRSKSRDGFNRNSSRSPARQSYRNGGSFESKSPRINSDSDKFSSRSDSDKFSARSRSDWAKSPRQRLNSDRRDRSSSRQRFNHDTRNGGSDYRNTSSAWNHEDST